MCGQPVEFTTLGGHRFSQWVNSKGLDNFMTSHNTVVMNTKKKVIDSHASGHQLIILEALQEFSYFLRML